MEQTDTLTGHASVRSRNVRRSTVNVLTWGQHAERNASVVSVATNSMNILVSNFRVQ